MSASDMVHATTVSATTVSATTVSIDRRGVMLRGRSGTGKSDLALRLIEEGAELVADDRTVLRHQDGSVIAACLPEGAGLIEVRGVGIPRLPKHADAVPVALLVDLHPRGHPIARLPNPSYEMIFGVSLPRVDLCAMESSAAIKVRIALNHGVGICP